METQATRGSNEITSVVYDYIINIEKTLKNENKRNIELRLFSDACGSQNRNYTMMAMLMRLAEKSTVFSQIQHYFPIRGHSYLPPDRVFGNVEKKYREKETMLVPSEYYDILNKFGKCLVLGKDWKVFDFKQITDKILKKKQPFKISQVRVITYKKDKLVIQNTYSGPTIEVAPLKQGVKNFEAMDTPKEIPFKNCVSVKKQNDVRKLLSFFDTSSVEATSFYQEIFDVVQNDDNDNIEADYSDNDNIY